MRYIRPSGHTTRASVAGARVGILILIRVIIISSVSSGPKSCRVVSRRHWRTAENSIRKPKLLDRDPPEELTACEKWHLEVAGSDPRKGGTRQQWWHGVRAPGGRMPFS